MNFKDQKALSPLLAEKSIFIFGGLGGVGKTTSSAAFGWSLAGLGAKVLVVTVDPAKRLLDTFGSSVSYINGAVVSNDPVRIHYPQGGRVSLGDGGGELWVSMLDTKVSFDSLIVRICENKAQSEAIIANDIYKNISSGFAYGSEYIAMERVLFLSEQQIWDYIIVDTPPGENLFRLLAAPQRMVQFFSSKALRLLVAPYRSKVLNLASKPFYEIVDHLLGLEMLVKIGEFFKLFEPVRIKFLKRSKEVEAMLKDARTTHVLVTALDALRSVEIENFITSFIESDCSLDAIVCNLSLPSFLGNSINNDLATFFMESSTILASDLAPKILSNDLITHNPPQEGKRQSEGADMQPDGSRSSRKPPSVQRATLSVESSAPMAKDANGLSAQLPDIELYDSKNNNSQEVGEKAIPPDGLPDGETKIVLSELLKSIGNNFVNLSLVEAEQSMLYRKILDLVDLAYSQKKTTNSTPKARIIRLPYISAENDEIEKIAYLGKAILEGL